MQEIVEAVTELQERAVPFGPSLEAEVIRNGNRAILQANKTVLAKKIKELGSVTGRKIVIIGLGEQKGEGGKYHDYYIALEDQARRDGAIS